jgi:excinuclease ABC subunit C
LLELNDLHRIEAYDISNIYGVYSVGSMVVYENGKKKSNAYRRFKIKTVEGSDDYTSMQEVIYRRFKRGKDELDKINKNELTVDRGKFNVFPNLLLIDGGKGHVSVVQKVLNALNIDLPVCGMVKDDYHKTRGLYYKGEEIHFGQNKYAYQLIYKIQEEVHRFAINYHKSLRRSNMTKSVLDEISGIGESRKISLMKHFEKIENVKRASVEELCEVKGISEKIAEKIYSFFNS